MIQAVTRDLWKSFGWAGHFCLKGHVSTNKPQKGHGGLAITWIHDAQATPSIAPFKNHPIKKRGQATATFKKAD